MEDNMDNNIGTEPGGGRWKSTLDLRGDSPWDSTGQKENAWEALHRRLQVEGRETGARTAMEAQPYRFTSLRNYAVAAALVLGIALITGFGIAMKNKRGATSQVIPPPAPTHSISGPQSPGDAFVNASTPSPGQASIKSSADASGVVLVKPSSKGPNKSFKSLLPKTPDVLSPERQERSERQEPLPKTEQENKTPAVASATEPFIAVTPDPKPNTATVHTPLKVISVNELQGTQDEGVVDKNGKTMHALQIQWLHQSPHTEVSYQDDKTPNAGIQVKVH
jgi:hypothetical protein